MGLGGWPAMTDDDGSTQFGTIPNKALFDSIKASIEGSVFSVLNPTVSPADIADEIVTARGNKASLNARLSVALDPDGNLLLPASLVSISTAQTLLAAKNLWSDSQLYLWPDGDSSAPYGWTLSGTGATVARTGSGGAGYEAAAPGDTTKMLYGKFAAKLTYGSASAKLTRSFIAAADFPLGLRNRKIAVGVRCKAGVANMASLIVDDGVTQTRAGSGGNGTYHAGDNTEKWLYAVHTFSSSATKLDLVLEVAQAGSAYFSCGVWSISDLAPVDWFPERWGFLKIGQALRGNVSVANTINEARIDAFELPAILYDTRLRCKTAPLTTAITVRPSKGTATYPYSTNPTIAAAATSGSKRPDGTYANRCFKPGDFLCWDITTIGTGTVGDELQPVFVFLVPMPDLDLLKL